MGLLLSGAHMASIQVHLITHSVCACCIGISAVRAPVQAARDVQQVPVRCWKGVRRHLDHLHRAQQHPQLRQPLYDKAFYSAGAGGHIFD